MNYYNAVDASHPGAHLPKGTSILFGYIGAMDLSGKPDTPHVWTLTDWNRYLSPHGDLYAGPHVRPVPVYTHDYPGDPARDAQNAVDAMADLGWYDNVGRLLFWDAEALIDPWYTDALAVECMRRGVRLGKYGELSTIESDPPVPGGTWFAKWQDTKPTAIPASLGVAWQWASPTQAGGDWDLSICSPFVYANAGRGVRHIEP